MAQSQFSLSWGSHKRNISNGLSIFQQNGEFVDMTLAADGHFVKVHQVIIALSSPYIKDLLSSAPCPHPVLFLNNISYKTLCAILEYIYTGEVYVSVENLVPLKVAAKELHIKGLEDMNIPRSMAGDDEPVETEDLQDTEPNDSNMVVLDENIRYFELTNPSDEKRTTYILPDVQNKEQQQDEIVNEDMESSYRFIIQHNVEDDISEVNSDLVKREITESANNIKIPPLQYTVSNQGSLQMILNRYMYYLKHTNRNNTQQWRCVDYLTGSKCPAHILTKNGVVAVRVAAHTHPFHDKKILKKIRAGAVYSAISEAEERGQNIKDNRNYEGNNESSE